MKPDILQNAVQGPNSILESEMPPEAEKNPLKENEMSKIGDQGEENPDAPSLIDEAMGMIDAAMAGIQQSPDPKVAIKSLCAELQSLVGDEDY